jgi:hypothetical protein
VSNATTERLAPTTMAERADMHKLWADQRIERALLHLERATVGLRANYGWAVVEKHVEAAVAALVGEQS